MKLYVIDCERGQYLSTLTIKVSGRTGGKASATFADGPYDRRHPPIAYADKRHADQLLALCQNGAKETSAGWTVGLVEYGPEARP